MSRTALLLAAYGSANIYSQRAIRKFENMCRQRFPGQPVRWAFTSMLLRERMAGLRMKSDSVLKALERLWYEKFSSAVVQPLQSIPGGEYQYVCLQVEEAVNALGIRCAIGAPLMAEAVDAGKVARAMMAHLPPERGPDDDIIILGHGARHAARALYLALAAELASLDGHIFFGTINDPQSLDNILPRLNSQIIWLLPMLALVGKHTIDDMAGRAATSWLSRIEAAGHRCVPIIRGISEYESLANLWLDNLEKALQKSRITLDNTGANN